MADAVAQRCALAGLARAYIAGQASYVVAVVIVVEPPPRRRLVALHCLLIGIIKDPTGRVGEL